MARDTPFHEFAIAFPQAALALLGLSHLRGPYRGETVRVKAEREVDVLLRPLEEGAGPRVYVELQGYPDAEIERRMLEEVVLHCNREGCREQVLAVILYTRASLREQAADAGIGPPDDPLVVFRPRRLILPEQPFEGLEQQGGAALVALPLVGSAEQVARRARDWQLRLREAPGLTDEQRRRALELFVRFLSDRLDSMDVEALLEEGARVVEHTVTGQRLIEKGEHRGSQRTILKVLETRFGSLSEALADRIREVHDAGRLEDMAAYAAVAESLVAFERRMAEQG